MIHATEINQNEMTGINEEVQTKPFEKESESRTSQREANWQALRGDVIVGTSSEWAKADLYANCFKGLLPDVALAAAIVTCQFTFQGPDASGENWGAGVRTKLATYGYPLPQSTSGDRYQQSKVGRNWKSLDATNAVDDILGFVGLTTDDVYNRFGKPEEGEVKKVKLLTILEQFVPLPANN